MLILDKPRRYDGKSIIVPLYHRGHMSLFRGTKVWLCLLPGREESRRIPELVVSPIDFDVWGDVWHINVVLQERKGVVNDVLSAIKERRLNIVALESSSMEEQRLHSVEMIVEGRDYSSHEDKDSMTRSTLAGADLSSLRRRLLTLFLPGLDFVHSGEPRLKIYRNRNLFEARNDYYQALRIWDTLGGFRPVYKPAELKKATDLHPTNGTQTEDLIEVRGARYVLADSLTRVIQLPTEIKESLNEELGRIEKPEAKNRRKYLLLSETDDRFLRAYFFSSASPIIAPIFDHEEKIGALEAITKQLRRGGFNILTSLTRVYEFGKKGRTEFVLEPPDDTVANVGDVHSQLKSALSTTRLISEFKLEVSESGRKIELGGGLNEEAIQDPDMASFQSNPGAVRFRLLGDGETVASRLTELRKYYEELIQKASVPSNVGYIIEQIDFLLKQVSISDGRDQSAEFSIFISHPFEDEAAYSQAELLAREVGFKVVKGGKSLAGGRTVRQGVIEQIRLCTHFLGMWTDKCPRKGKKHVPSSWLTWELGVAEDREKPFRLFVHEAVDGKTWSFVDDIEHIKYGPMDFKEKLRAALEALYDEQTNLHARSSR
ncbi:hypothetical protein IT157_02225 [bacterium]|nr:hypothetical protein [bacterium]